MPDKIARQNELCSEALRAESAGDVAAAATLYRQAILVDRSNPTPYLFYGYTLYQQGRSESALEAWSIGTDIDSRLINAWRAAQPNEEIARRSRLAHDAIRTHFTDLHRRTIAEYRESHPDANVDRIDAAIWCQTHDTRFEYRHPNQQPQLFYVPSLTPIPVIDGNDLPWCNELEAAWPLIRDEFAAAQQAVAREQRPYLDASVRALGPAWEPLAESLNWSSLQLYKQGEPNPALIDRFPQTLELLDRIPLVQMSGGPSEVLFSVLAPKQHIPPHYGVSNTDITVHLPIVTPPDVAIRVCDETYPWREGKLFVFDDAFLHESWNASDEQRVNLLFEVWHPELTTDEQAAISACFDARKNWNRQRNIQDDG